MELAKSITKALGGDWRGAYGLVPGLGHSDNDRSMKVAQHPDNPNDVVLHSFAGDDWRSFKDHLRRRRLLSRWQAKGQARPAGISRKFKPEGNRADNREWRIKQAQKLWAEALPADGTLVGSYLRSRCINLTVPRALRFDPNCYYDHDTRLPAMIAALWHHQEQRIVAVHRTYLNPSGTGKADVETPKKALGPISGAGTVLSRFGREVVVAEGIETALSVQQTTGIPAISAISAPGIGALILPNDVQRITIAGDNDGHKPEVEQQYRHAALRWHNEGKAVFIASPVELGLDFNDLLMAEGSFND